LRKLFLLCWTTWSLELIELLHGLGTLFFCISYYDSFTVEICSSAITFSSGIEEGSGTFEINNKLVL
jgi:hypothetical protein